MPAPRKRTGTLSPMNRTTPGGEGVGPNVGTKGGKDTGNGGKGSKKGGKKKKGGKSNFDYSITPLNPPFDPRMRQIGNPVVGAAKIKRGWVQTDEDNLRVNFLFNPSQLDVSHQVNTDLVRNPSSAPTNDVMDPNYPSSGSSLGIKLLYDRSYEIVSGGGSYAERYGVWADVAAWYVLLGMLPDMPVSWQDSIIVQPATIRTAYLFLGTKMVYYGYLTGISVTYSHWNINMVPVRCSVDLSMELVPHTGGAPVAGKTSDAEIGSGLTEDWLSGQVPDYGV